MCCKVHCKNTVMTFFLKINVVSAYQFHTLSNWGWRIIDKGSKLPFLSLNSGTYRKFLELRMDITLWWLLVVLSAQGPHFPSTCAPRGAGLWGSALKKGPVVAPGGRPTLPWRPSPQVLPRPGLPSCGLLNGCVRLLCLFSLGKEQLLNSHLFPPFHKTLTFWRVWTNWLINCLNSLDLSHCSFACRL